MARGIALLVGLTSVDPAAYHGWDGKVGCEGSERDVGNMVKVVSSAGKYEIKTLMTQQATASAILTGIESVADTLKPGDMFAFYYSGHGGRKPDINGDEPDKYDDTLVAYDREIIDDELAKLWLEFAPGVRIVMLSDSCNSGTNEGYIIKVLGAKPPKPPIQELMPISFAGKVSGMNAQLIHFGACRDGQASAGYPLGGAFTLALNEIWNNGRFSGTYREFYEVIKKRLKKAGELQVPQFNKYGNVQPDFLNSKPFSLS